MGTQTGDKIPPNRTEEQVKSMDEHERHAYYSQLMQSYRSDGAMMAAIALEIIELRWALESIERSLGTIKDIMYGAGIRP